MSRLIEKLYNSHINSQDRNVSENSSYAMAQKKEIEAERRLMNLLNDEQKEKFLDYMEIESDAAAIENLESFATGFRLGARLFYEVLIEDKI